MFAMLSEGKRHDDIAAAVGLSVRRVEDIAVKFRAELVAQSDATKQAAIDGALLAKQHAREHALRAMELLSNQVGDEALSAGDRRAAAVALLDRAGVGTKSEIDSNVRNDTVVTVATVEEIERARAALRTLDEDRKKLGIE